MIKCVLFYFNYCWKIEKKYIIFLLSIELLQVIMSVSTIVLPKFIIDELFGAKIMTNIVFYIGLYLFLILTINILTSILKYFVEKCRDKMYRNFSLSFAEKSMNIEYKYFENPKFLDLREKALKCMSSNYGFAGMILLLVNLLGKLLYISSIIFIVSTLNILLLLACIGLIILSVYINSKMQKRNTQLDLESVAAQRKTEYIRSIGDDSQYSKEIRIYNFSLWINNLYVDWFKRLFAFKEKQIRNSLKANSSAAFINLLQQVISYIYLIVKVFSDNLTMGSFTMYLGAIATFNASITEGLNIIAHLRSVSIYFEPFKEYMEMQYGMSYKGNQTVKDIPINIEFVNVSFQYPGQKDFALKDVSISINSGSKTAIVGENGAGKTTLIKLLTRLYEPTQGKILLNGIDISLYDYTELMGLFSVVFQDFKLFALSIKENILLNNTGMSNDEIMKVSENIKLNDKILSLNNQLETPVYKVFDENGFEPSGGEAQKIAMARAFVKNGSIVILDEPTSALDPRAEYEIYQNFSELTKNKTAFYISHRLTSCRICDNIMVLKNGSLIEYGSHDELYSNNGYYRELFDIQAKYYT